MQGWIKFYRNILDNPVVCRDSDYFSVWCFLLLNATHKEQYKIFNGKKILLKKGQIITGRNKISEKFGISTSKVQRILKSLEGEQQIEQQTSNKNRLITILNWSSYQESEQQSEQQVNSTFDDFSKNQNEKSQKVNSKMNNKKSPLKQDISIDSKSYYKESEQQIEQQVNNKRTTSEQQVNTNNNDKNVIMKQCNKNNKYIVEKKIFDYWNSKKNIQHQDNAFNKNKTKIKTAVKKYGKDEIIKAIDRLDTALKDNEFYYSYRWNLFNFLKQSNGISNWLDDGQIYSDYLNKRGGNYDRFASYNKQNNREQESEYEGMFDRFKG